MTILAILGGVFVIPALTTAIAHLITRKIGGSWTEFKAASSAMGTLSVELAGACIIEGFAGIGISILAFFAGIVLFLQYLGFLCEFPHWGSRR